MTQDVQPLTWSKRTNIEEHQQFFSKINEIIDNLAPTVDEAEQAIAQATAAIASANDAVATANAASAAASAAASQASAAASQAQTAASTVAGYDNRLTAVEGDIDALQAADQTITGNISALGTRMTAAESKNSQQDTDIAALQTTDAQNVKIDRINDYAVGVTGNQDNILGEKAFANMVGYPGKIRFPPSGQQIDKYTPVFSIPNSHRSIDIELWTSGARGGRAKLHIDTQGSNDNNAYYLFRKGQNTLSTLSYDDAAIVTVEDDQVTVWLKYRQYSEVAYWISMYIVYDKLKEGELITFTDSTAPRLTAAEIESQYTRVINPTV